MKKLFNVIVVSTDKHNTYTDGSRINEVTDRVRTDNISYLYKRLVDYIDDIYGDYKYRYFDEDTLEEIFVSKTADGFKYGVCEHSTFDTEDETISTEYCAGWLVTYYDKDGNTLYFTRE